MKRTILYSLAFALVASFGAFAAEVQPQDYYGKIARRRRARHGDRHRTVETAQLLREGDVFVRTQKTDAITAARHNVKRLTPDRARRAENRYFFGHTRPFCKLYL